ncbi:DUF2298 domain-containing protein [Natronomonas sp. EA1]|uniref:DUF2298 domain-containing protein n=1 Tax=Natronomonas sp. EA1 TaxID=3421655 RepID=UPI003EC143ED
MEYGLVVRWLATYLLLGVASYPIAAALFPRLHDRGASLTIPIGLAVLGVVGYLVGQVSFGLLALLAGILVLLGLSFAVGDTQFDRRGFLEPAAVFTVAFLFMVAIRAVDPAIHPYAGEKFLDFSLLNSLLRAEALPPEDPWFAGAGVKYYYGGHLLSALLATLTFTSSPYAYNLALAGFYAAYVTAGYGLASNVAAHVGAPRRLAGGLTAFFVGLAGNLYVAGAFLLYLLPDGLAGSIVGPENPMLEWTPETFSYWTPTRIITGSINEFPLFAWLNGDLHAHMMSTPFLLLAATLLYAYWRTPEEEIRRRRLLVFGALPPVAGLLALVNTWSFPAAAFGLPALTLYFAPTDPRTLLPERAREALSGEHAVSEELLRGVSALSLVLPVILLGVGWSLPFWFGTASGRSLGFLPERSALWELLLIHGAFLLAFGLYTGRRIAREATNPLTVLGAVVALLVVSVLADAPAVGLFLPLLLAGWYLLRRDTEVGFETVLLIGGVGIVLLVEFVFVQEEAGPGRFNTVFKTYAQVWALWAPALGVVLARLVGGVSGPSSETWRTVGRGVTAVLVLTTGMYAAFAVPQHIESDSVFGSADEPTLDGTAYVADRHPGELEAIRWLDDRAGQPNIASAPGCWCNPADTVQPYSWANAPSTMTGIPTVAGWSHEVGYRGQETYRQRVADVETIFTGNDSAQSRLLAAYEVEYVYVGPNERSLYGSAITITNHSAVTVAHRSGDVTILAVDQSVL